mgnify:CR=1 FL=1
MSPCFGAARLTLSALLGVSIWSATDSLRSAQIASDSRGKLHKRIDGVAADVENKIQHVRERVVVLETKATV